MDAQATRGPACDADLNYPHPGQVVMTDAGVLCNWVALCQWCGELWAQHDHATGACPNRNEHGLNLRFTVRGWVAQGSIGGPW